MQIRAATTDDLDDMWQLFRAVIATGDALPFPEDFDLDTFRSHWFGAHRAHVATLEGEGLVGMYKMGANYPGPGSHVASATYLVRPDVQGQGIGRALVEDSLARAQAEGFLSMQFNFVVGTNTAALALYAKLGFAIVGTLPRAFRHRELGLVDAHVMSRTLTAHSA